MKHSKLLCMVAAITMCIQSGAFASGCEQNAEKITETSITSEIQPRGVYLLGGGCSITPYSGYVHVGGYTDSYYDVSEITVQVTLLQEISPGCWLAIWSDSATEYGTCNVGYSKNVEVESGYNYMVEAVHTVKHGGLTESNDSDAGGVYVG